MPLFHSLIMFVLWPNHQRRCQLSVFLALFTPDHSGSHNQFTFHFLLVRRSLISAACTESSALKTSVMLVTKNTLSILIKPYLCLILVSFDRI